MGGELYIPLHGSLKLTHTHLPSRHGRKGKYNYTTYNMGSNCSTVVRNGHLDAVQLKHSKRQAKLHFAEFFGLELSEHS